MCAPARYSSPVTFRCCHRARGQLAGVSASPRSCSTWRARPWRRVYASRSFDRRVGSRERAIRDILFSSLSHTRTLHVHEKVDARSISMYSIYVRAHTCMHASVCMCVCVRARNVNGKIVGYGFNRRLQLRL